MINCIVVDDESLALEMLAGDIEQVDFLRLVKKCSRAEEAMEVLKTQKIDLIFLDIQMPGISGIQFLKSLKNPPAVIFITAYEKYAMEGYELDVVDYLLKPVSYKRFLKACDKAKEIISFRNKFTPNDKEDFFFIRSEYRTIKLHNDEVLYIEGLKDYVKIFCTNREQPVLTRLNLKNMEDLLNPEKFIRIHRSYIINLSKVEAFKKTHLDIAQKELPIGDLYREQFLKKFKT